MATITNGMKTVLKTDKEVTGLAGWMFLHELELLWELAIHFENDSVRLEPLKVTTAILRYKESRETDKVQVLDISNFTAKFHVQSERKNLEVKIDYVHLMPEVRTIVVTI